MYEHKSGLPHAIDRAAEKPEQQSVVFYGKEALVQGGELNDMQTIIRGRHDRLGRLIARDGDRIERAEAIVDIEAKAVTLTEGRVFASGDHFPVAAAVLQNVPMTGRVDIGVWLKRKYITHEDDPSLLGQVPGTLAEGEPGAAREEVKLEWGFTNDGNTGEFYSVYLLENGTILDQTKPPALDGMLQAIALYDRAHGHYIVKGCRVTALGADDGNQVFSIEQGEANISGFKRTRHASIRHAEPEIWDVGAVPGETHLYSGGASVTITTAHSPIDQVSSILLIKEKTVSVTRGALVHGIDGLPDNSVTELREVKQGSRIFAKDADYRLTGNGVDWAAPGEEPATGSTYQVTYRYRDSVQPQSITDRTITVAGGAAGSEVIIAYTYKLPRIDMLCLNEDGSPVYVKGVSALSQPMKPVPPLNVLPLCEIYNTWTEKPVVINNGTRIPPYDEQWRYFNRLFDLDRLVQLERLKSGVDAREPVAKKNTFVDPFKDDSYRDLGELQSGAIDQGMLQLAISATFYQTTLLTPVTLDYVEDIVVDQALITGCVKINPYQNFFPLPAKMGLVPATDFWTISQTQWLSPETREFNRGVRTDGGPLTESSSTDMVIDHRQEQAEFLREIPVQFTITGFGTGELLEELTFDGINILPAQQLSGDADGAITGSFVIPANVTAGTKTVFAKGGSGAIAEALFTGQGTIEIDVMRRVTTINRYSRPPVSNREQSEGGGRGDADPQAQNFTLPEMRQLIGMDFHLCKIGDKKNNILVHQVTVENGTPTVELMAEGFVPMRNAVTGWQQARYALPVTTPNDRDHAFVVKTDDGEHSISIAALGGFDEVNQKWITAHPYPIGPRQSSVNARTWTPHQGEALSFRMIAARYTQTTKVVELGTFDLVDCSDLQVRAAIELPSAACSVVFEVERTNGTIYRLLPFQVLQLTEYLTETVQLRVVLKGTEKLSPILYAPIELIAGKIAQEFTYICRAFKFGEPVTLTSYFKAFLPGGATVKIEYDLADGSWQELPLVDTEQLSFPQWVERKNSVTNIRAHQGRLKITGTGGPSARLIVGDLGAAIM